MTEEELLALYEKAIDQGRNRERSYVSKDTEKASQLQSNRSQGFIGLLNQREIHPHKG